MVAFWVSWVFIGVGQGLLERLDMGRLDYEGILVVLLAWGCICVGALVFVTKVLILAFRGITH